MGNVSRSLIPSLINCAVWCLALLWIAAEAQALEKIPGIDAEGYGEYNPDVAVGVDLNRYAIVIMDRLAGTTG